MGAWRGRGCKPIECKLSFADEGVLLEAEQVEINVKHVLASVLGVEVHRRRHRERENARARERRLPRTLQGVRSVLAIL